MKTHISGYAVSLAEKNLFDFTENSGKQTNETERHKQFVSLQTPLLVEQQASNTLHIRGVLV